MANKSQWKCLRKRHCSGQSTLWACIDFPLYLFSDWLAHEGQWCWPLSSSDSKQRQASHRLVTGSGVWSGVWLLRVSRLTLHGYLLHDSWQDEDEECRKCQRSKGAMQEVFPLSHKLVLLSCDDKGMFFTSLITFRFSFRPFHPPHAVLYFPFLANKKYTLKWGQRNTYNWMFLYYLIFLNGRNNWWLSLIQTFSKWWVGL